MVEMYRTGVSSEGSFGGHESRRQRMEATTRPGELFRSGDSDAIGFRLESVSCQSATRVIDAITGSLNVSL